MKNKDYKNRIISNFCISDKITFALNSKQSAEEMFKELGYEKECFEDTYGSLMLISYTIECIPKGINRIDFRYDKKTKEVGVSACHSDLLDHIYHYQPISFTNELPAIVKQLEELEDENEK